MSVQESFDVIVIGAGQAGLATGWHLARRGVRFVILEGGARIGDSWRKRWDSLRLFTPARYDGLVGMPYPSHPDYFPTKDEMGDYLEAYAKRFDLPVRRQTRVERVSRRDGRYVVEAGGHELIADHVVVANASYQRPRMPAFGADLDASIVQLHSSEYKNPGQLKPGAVLLVGAGNSGAEIALDLAKTHTVQLSGRDVGHLPFRHDGWLGRKLLVRLVLGFVFNHVLTIRTPMGRKARPGFVGRGGLWIRARPWQLQERGVERVGRVAGAQDGKPVLEDGRVLDVQSVIWCTGFGPGLDWIDLPVLDEHGEPRQEAGVATAEPGLYYVGLHFQYAPSSTMVQGVSRDAGRVVDTIAARMAAAPARVATQAAAWPEGSRSA